ncbi:tyrosine-type recombinase/integrase [Nonomuraea angiospora]|uniref:tyrosine-type recombinase/integrase n=1 Tax=Nonomuraea angiospora TaxID=46172 RepID=UPI0034442FE0
MLTYDGRTRQHRGGRTAAVGRLHRRLSARSINTIVGEIGRLHDAQTSDPDRKLGTVRPHDARHTFAFQLSQASGHNRAELERRLGHAHLNCLGCPIASSGPTQGLRALGQIPVLPETEGAEAGNGT